MNLLNEIHMDLKRNPFVWQGVDYPLDAVLGWEELIDNLTLEEAFEAADQRIRKKLSNYIFIEVDIDVNTVLSSRLRVSSIPRVIVQVANTQNDIFFDKLGYSSKTEYLRELQYFNSFNKALK